MLLFVAAVAAAIAINVFTSSTNFGLTPPQELFLREGIVVVLLAYPFVSIVVHYLRWSAEQYVVTNLRVIHLSGVLNKSVIDSSLEKVNDVLLRQSFAGRILGYGDLEILTAAEAGVNRFTRLAQPLAFKNAMLEAKLELERGVRKNTEAIPDLIARLAALRDQGAISEQEFQTEKTRLLREL